MRPPSASCGIVQGRRSLTAWPRAILGYPGPRYDVWGDENAWQGHAHTPSHTKSNSMASGPVTHDDRVAFRRGLSPYAILSSIDLHLYTHFRTPRELFLTMDAGRVGVVTHDAVVDGFERLGVHPEILRSTQLKRLLAQFPSHKPGHLDSDEFAKFLAQYLGTPAPEPSVAARRRSFDVAQESAIVAIR